MPQRRCFFLEVCADYTNQAFLSKLKSQGFEALGFAVLVVMSGNLLTPDFKQDTFW